MEAEYLQTALNATRLAIRLRAGREGEVGGLVLSLMLAELDARWKDLGGRHPDLLSPEEIRVLLPTLSAHGAAQADSLDWMRKLANSVGRTFGFEKTPVHMISPQVMQRRINSAL